jgi:hypothetical protein
MDSDHHCQCGCVMRASCSSNWSPLVWQCFTIRQIRFGTRYGRYLAEECPLRGARAAACAATFRSSGKLLMQVSERASEGDQAGGALTALRRAIRGQFPPEREPLGGMREYTSLAAPSSAVVHRRPQSCLPGACRRVMPRSIPSPTTPRRGPRR